MHRRRLLQAIALGLALTCMPAVARETPALTVYAAASMTDALKEIGADFTARTGTPVRFNFAASSLLARQIQAGAPADVFFSADIEWMDYLQQRGLVLPKSRRIVAGNRLVLIAPAGSTTRVALTDGVDLVTPLGPRAKLAMADPEFVPAGRYAKSALVSLGAWDALADRLARAQNVRDALLYVARGEAPLGIVYETDAKIEPKVRVLAVFPARTHAPILYPAALTRQATQPMAQAFLDAVTAQAGRATLQRFGFVLP